MISEAQRAEIKRLFFAEHWKVGTIATQLGLHHETVRRTLGTERFVRAGVLVRKSALDGFLPFIQETLERHPRLSAYRVFEMVKARGYVGSARQVRRRITQLGLRPVPRTEAFLRLCPTPGEEGQVDWGHFGKLKVGGSERPLYFFVVVLSWSRAVHVDFSFEQTMAAVVRGHIRAFDAFGGVPRRLLYDNMKTVVVERVGDAIRFHPRLLELAGHYHFQPRPCAPRRGNEKGRVERRIRDLRTSFVAGREFHSLDDLRRQFQDWRDEVAFERPCPQNTSQTVRQALEQERPNLLPLPEHPLDAEETRPIIARKQPYIRFDGNLYSIPAHLVGVPLTLSASDTRIRLFQQGNPVAEHTRCWERGRTLEQREHIEPLIDQKRHGRIAACRNRLTAAIPEAQALYQLLIERGEPLGPNTQALLRLLDRHGREALKTAILEALARQTPGAASVARLLAQRHTGRPPVPLSLPDHPGVRDLRTQHHDLGDYDR